MHKLIIFGVGAIVGIIGAVAVLSKLSEKDMFQDWECDGDCEHCDDCGHDVSKRTQHSVEPHKEGRIDMSKALAEMCGKMQREISKVLADEQGVEHPVSVEVTHTIHCGPADTSKSVDWDDPCLECTNKGGDHCDKGIENCPFADNAAANETDKADT